MRDFTKYAGYIQLDVPINFGQFEAIGWFPYERAQISNFREVATPPRELFLFIEDALNRNGISDNKYVVIFRDKVNFGTDDFAIQFKDCYCKIGSLDSVVGYACRELELKPKIIKN